MVTYFLQTVSSSSIASVWYMLTERFPQKLPIGCYDCGVEINIDIGEVMTVSHFSDVETGSVRW